MKCITVTFSTNTIREFLASTFLCVDPTNLQLIRDTLNQDLKENWVGSAKWYGTEVKNIVSIEDAPDEDRPSHGSIYPVDSI